MKACVIHVQCTTLMWLGILLASPVARLAAQDLPVGNQESEYFEALGLNELADADATGASPAPSGSSPLSSVPVGPQENATDHFHWGPALGETLFFTSFMHAKRILFDPDTAPEFHGPLLKDYFRSVAGLHGWDDHDPFQVQYIGHSFHGAVDERIEFQNNPKAWDLGWGAPGYWHSRLIGAAWATLWGAQFKIGPYSEAMIGNVGLPNEYRHRPIPPGANYGLMAWSEFVVNPVGGTAWVVTEDLLDRYVAQRMEGNVNRRFMCFTRTFLTPSRSWANLLRFKKPWYRENRDIYGRPVNSH